MTSAAKQIPLFAYLGRGGPLSLAPLQELLGAGLSPALVVVPGVKQRRVGLNLANSQFPDQPSARSFPTLPVAPPRLPDSLAGFALEQGLPLVKYRQGEDHELANRLAAAGVSVVLVSCFPWRIPAALLAVPELGWWNLHPSLLPAYRGPAPLFWQLRAGEKETGVSLHQMDEAFDQGDIIAQQRMPLTGAKSGREIELALGKLGGKLMLDSLYAVAEKRLVVEAQQTSPASYQGLPGAEDLVIRPVGKAADAHRLISAAYTGYPLVIEVGGQRYRITAPGCVDESASLPTGSEWQGQRLRVQFQQGVLEVETGELLLWQ